MKTALTTGVILLSATSLFAHRLDEYLEATLLSVGKNRVEAQMTLTPGVAVLPYVMAQMDSDADGVISQAEQRAYARRVLDDLSISIDGAPLAVHLTSTKFPEVAEMKEGLGEIHIEFSADLPPGGGDRKLVIENRHAARIAAYQVNCLMPRDPDIRVIAQKRNYTQSHYELDFTQAGGRFGWWRAVRERFGTGMLLVVGGVAFLWRRRVSGVSKVTRSASGEPRR